MTKEEILNAKKLYEQLEDKAANLIYYIKGECSDSLKYGIYSSFEKLTVHDKFIEIIYVDCGADYYKDSLIDVPIDAFVGNEDSYKEWADNYVAEYLDRIEKWATKQSMEQEKREREEYERLKAKFEKGGQA